MGSRPADSILGEEFGRSGSSDRTWILDPIDATNFFTERDPNWRVQIALRVIDEIVLAVVDEPANGRRWWTSIGGGTWEQAGDDELRRLRASDCRVDPPTIAVHPPSIGDRLPAHQSPQVRSPLPLVDVIRGDLDGFFVDCCHVWDHAPWVLLVEKPAGASRITTADDGQIDAAGCTRVRQSTTSFSLEFVGAERSPVAAVWPPFRVVDRSPPSKASWSPGAGVGGPATPPGAGAAPTSVSRRGPSARGCRG